MVKGWRCQPSRASRLTSANWPGRNAKRSPRGRSQISNGRVVDGLDRGHLVVVGASDAPGQQLAVEVEGEPDATDRDVRPAQQLRAEDGRVHEAVGEAESEEDPGEPVEAAPQSVAADPPADEPDGGGLHQPEDGRTQRTRGDRAPARGDGPHGERRQTDDADRAERRAQLGGVRVARRRDVDADEDRPGHGDPPMPHRRLVDAVEELLDPAKRADQDEPDRQEQDALRPEQLADERARVAVGSGEHPEQSEDDDEGRDGRGPDHAGDEVRAAVGPAVSDLGLKGHAGSPM